MNDSQESQNPSIAPQEVSQATFLVASISFKKYSGVFFVWLAINFLVLITLFILRQTGFRFWDLLLSSNLQFLQSDLIISLITIFISSPIILSITFWLRKYTRVLISTLIFLGIILAGIYFGDLYLGALGLFNEITGPLFIIIFGSLFAVVASSIPSILATKSQLHNFFSLLKATIIPGVVSSFIFAVPMAIYTVPIIVGLSQEIIEVEQSKENVSYLKPEYIPVYLNKSSEGSFGNEGNYTNYTCKSDYGAEEIGLTISQISFEYSYLENIDQKLERFKVSKEDELVETVNINGHRGIYAEDHGQKGIYWETESQQNSVEFRLNCEPENVKQELIKIAESMKPAAQ